MAKIGVVSKTRKVGDVATVLIILATMIVIMSAISPAFRTVNNIGNIIVQVIPLAIVSIGQTFVILTGGIDLSIGSVISLTTAIASVTMGLNGTLGIMQGLIIAILAGLAIGLFNGLAVANLSVPPMITTIAMSTVLQGFVFKLRPGPGGIVSADYANFITARMGLLSVPLLIMVLLFLLSYYVLRHTALGRHIYAIGENRKVAKSMGIRVDKVTIVAYVWCSVLAVASGLILAGRIRAGDPVIGVPFGLDSVTAVVIGGTVLSGGRGNVLGSVAGAFIIGMLSNMLNLLGVSSFYQYVLKGTLLIIAMIVYSLTSMRGASGE